MKLYVMDLGMLVMRGSSPAAEEGSEVPVLPIHSFLLDTPIGKIVFDTGCVPGCMDGAWPQELHSNPYVPSPGGSLSDRLAQIGVTPEDVSYVVASHLHLDHAGWLHLFPNATVLVEKNELKQVMQRSEAGTLGMFHLPCDIANWNRANIRFKTVEQDFELCDGVTILDFGAGHSYGMLGMLVHLECGNFLLAADAVYGAVYYGPPAQLSGIVEDEAGYFRTIERLRDLEKMYHAKILFGHDSAQFATLVKSDAGYYK